MKSKVANPPPAWVVSLMRQAGNSLPQRELAEILGVTQPNVGRYLSGRQTPKINVITNLVNHLGGDMFRALPDWMPETEPSSIKVLGQVQAGGFSEAGEDDGWEVSLDITPWKEGPYTGLTHGPYGLVQVIGESMEPRYSAGEFLVCRKPNDPMGLQDLTPCIFREPRGNTFKMLRRTNTGKLVGQPLNPHHEIIEMDGRDVTVQLVVLGSVDLGYTKSPANHRR